MATLLADGLASPVDTTWKLQCSDDCILEGTLLLSSMIESQESPCCRQRSKNSLFKACLYHHKFEATIGGLGLYAQGIVLLLLKWMDSINLAQRKRPLGQVRCELLGAYIQVKKFSRVAMVSYQYNRGGRANVGTSRARG